LYSPRVCLEFVLSTSRYIVFGLEISSELALPELLPSTGPAEVEIRFAPVPRALAQVQAQGVRFQTNHHQTLLWVDDVARYLVTDGAEISIERMPGAHDDELRLFLLGAALGALLHQRGMLALHGGVIEADGGAAAVVGPSGVGKSTLLASLTKRGHRVLADDIVAVRIAGEAATVVPGPVQLKLWADAAQKLGQSPQQLQRVRRGIEKYRLPLEEMYCPDALPLRRIYALCTSPSGEPTLAPLTGIQKVMALVYNTFRLGMLPDSARASHFERCSALARQSRVCRVERPREQYLLAELTELIAKDLA
jgi:hypothetical protein